MMGNIEEEICIFSVQQTYWTTPKGSRVERKVSRLLGPLRMTESKLLRETNSVGTMEIVR